MTEFEMFAKVSFIIEAENEEEAAQKAYEELRKRIDDVGVDIEQISLGWELEI